MFATAVTATCPVIVSGKRTVISGLSDGSFCKSAGLTDNGAAVEYSLRTGALPLATERGSRDVTFVYDPTSSDSTLRLRLYYNNSSSPRVNAVASDRGTGFVTTTGSTEATLNMKLARSALGDSNGVARASFAGRVEERSSGGDKHVAIEVAGSQSSDAVTIHTIGVEGAG